MARKMYMEALLSNRQQIMKVVDEFYEELWNYLLNVRDFFAARVAYSY